MKGSYLIGSNTATVEPNIYADKSSLVLEWLLLKGIEKKQFTIREVAANTCVGSDKFRKFLAY